MHARLHYECKQTQHNVLTLYVDYVLIAINGALHVDYLRHENRCSVKWSVPWFD